MLYTKPASSLFLMLILSACAAPQGGFPSLERRAYEAGAPVATPTESRAAPSVLSAELAAQADALLARHRVAHDTYLGGLLAIQSTALRAAGTSPGSEGWVNAHVLLSRLDKMRSDSVGALRDFDRLIADAGTLDAGVATLLSAAQRPVAEDVALQNAEIARLSQLIGE